MAYRPLVHSFPSGSLSDDASTPVELEIHNLPGVPLYIRDAELKVSPVGNVEGIEYRLENNTEDALVAWVVWWDVYVEGATERAFRFSSLKDSWWGKSAAYLLPGMSESLTVRVGQSAKSPVARVVGTLAYAEFARGVRLGPGSDSLFAQLQAERLAVVRVYQTALDTYIAQGEQALAQWLGERTEASAVGVNPKFTAAKWYLAKIYGESGVHAVLAEIDRLLD